MSKAILETSRMTITLIDGSIITCLVWQWEDNNDFHIIRKDEDRETLIYKHSIVKIHFELKEKTTEPEHKLIK